MLMILPHSILKKYSSVIIMAVAKKGQTFVLSGVKFQVLLVFCFSHCSVRGLLAVDGHTAVSVFAEVVHGGGVATRRLLMLLRC